MAFSIDDLQDLIALLAEKPEWRAQLRPLILGDELDRLPQVVQELAEAQRRTEARVAELAEMVKELVGGQRDLTAQVSRLTLAVSELQADGGALYEVRFERKAPSLFGQWLRKPRVVSLNDLDAFENAIDSGTLNFAEIEALRALDLIVVGSDREAPERPETYFAVEISRTLDDDDVERAADRARLLQKLGYRSRAAVGGKAASQRLLDLAKKREVEVRLLDTAG